MAPSDPSSSPSSTIPSSSQPTPKRKRETDTTPPTPPASSPNMRLNTNIPGAILMTDEERNGSPRTKVAYHFQGLQLEDGGAVSKLDLQKGNAPKFEARDESLLAESAVRKRVRTLGGHNMLPPSPVREIPETPVSKSFHIVIGDERVVDPIVAEKAGKVILHNEIDPVIFKGTTVGKLKGAGGLGRSYPSINRLSESKSRAPRKRLGTPPLFGAAEASLEMHDGSGEKKEVDPDRAALTWHDNEITGHDPDDPDDDGEGINGIGFKPTPAMAYARTEKRRAQMAEYRKREAGEARAKRNERRRGSEASKPNSDELETARRVRFLEGDAKSSISN